jgi:hypothetical protein
MQVRLSGSEEIELLSICTRIVEEKEPMGFCPGWIRAMPAKASQVGTTPGVEDHPLLFEQCLLVVSCTDSTLRVDNPLPGNSWPWSAIA